MRFAYPTCIQPAPVSLTPCKWLARFCATNLYICKHFLLQATRNRPYLLA